MVVSNSEAARCQMRWLEIQIDELPDWKQRVVNDDEVKRPKIQRVPGYMGGRTEFEKFYTPKLISFGLIHFNKHYVQLGQQYKLKWTLMYLENTNQSLGDLFKRICDRISELQLRELLSSWEDLGFNDILYILMVDGCSILQVLDKSDPSVDAEQELKVSVDQLVWVHQDLLLLENQIPYQVLKIICNDEAKLNKCMQNFLQILGVTTASTTGKQDLGTENTGAEVIVQAEEEKDPIHLLDYLHTALLRSSGSDDADADHWKVKNNRKSLHLRKYRTGSIRELIAAGIRVKKLPSSTSWHPRFVDGKLYLPELTVDGSTALSFLNLIAYEMCPDFRNDFQVSSYIVFLSSLIDQPEDVKELRSAGILHNELANDKEVADLFNKMDTVLVPETARFAHIKNQIEAHFESKHNKIKMLAWMGEAYNTFFRSPWTIIALLAATLGLVLTFIQTWFAIHPKN